MHKNYLKSGRKIVSFLALAAMSQLSYAQIDVTSSFLVNPDFESEDQFEGWDLTEFENQGNSNGGKTQVRVEKELGVGFFSGINAVEKWTNSGNSTLGTFDVSQEITLPAGTYQFSVGAKGINQHYSKMYDHVTGLYLYANDNKVVISTPMAKDFSNNIQEGQTWPCSEFFKVEITLQEEGPVRFGFAAEETSANWICFDNFRMYLVSCDDMKVMYKAQVNQMITDFNSDENYDFITGNFKVLLAADGAIAQEAEELYANADATEEDYKALYDKVNEVVAEAKLTIPYMTELYDKTNEYMSYADATEFPGIDIFYEILTEAIDLYVGELTTLEDVKAILPLMDEAFFTYKISSAEGATEDAPADLTAVIVNPTIEEGTVAGNNKQLNGWNCSNSGGNGNYICFDGDNVMMECWSGTPAGLNFDYYQEFKGLPNGMYSISADARGNQEDPNGNAVVYASSANEKFAKVYNPVILGIGEDDSQLSTYEVTGIFVSDGTLRIGAKNIGELSNKWTVYDNFKLFYHGNENEVVSYQAALSDRIQEATQYLTADMLPMDINTIKYAIYDAEDNLASESVEILKSSIDALVAAIENANDAIDVVKQFRSGNYNKVLTYETEDADLLAITEIVIESVDEIFNQVSTTSFELDVMSAQMGELLSFFNSYIAAQGEVGNGISYNKDAIDTYLAKIDSIIKSLNSYSALDMVEQANADLEAAILEIRGTLISDNNIQDVTFWAINPGFENNLSGWTNNGMGSQGNNSFAEKTGDIYCERWTNDGFNIPDVDIHQTVVVPAGKYTIKVDASAKQVETDVIDGVTLFACNGDVNGARYTTDIKSEYIVAPETESEFVQKEDELGQPVLDEDGNPVMEEIITVIKPGELTYELEISATTGVLTFGIQAKNATCHWLRFDNFQIIYNGEIPNSIEDVNEDSSFVVYVKGKQIIVSGVENYTVYSSNGQIVSANAELAPGLYIVNANGKSVKVAVK